MHNLIFNYTDFIIKSLLVLTFITSIISFIFNLRFKTCEKWLKTNSIISHISITLFAPLYYILLNYLIDTYLVNFSSTYTYTGINIILALAALIFTSINYIFKDKTKLIRFYEIISLLIPIVISVSMLFSKYSDKSYILLNFITVIFCEYFIVNANENLQNKASKSIYLTTNLIISTVLIVSLISLIIKLSFKFDLALILIGLIVLIFALVPLLTAYKTLKKEKKND